MYRHALRDFGADAADVAAAFFGRNALVILGLTTLLLVALARP